MCTYIDILKYRVVNEMTTQRATNKQQGNKETTTSEANGRTGDKYQFQVTLVAWKSIESTIDGGKNDYSDPIPTDTVIQI